MRPSLRLLNLVLLLGVAIGTSGCWQFFQTIITAAGCTDCGLEVSSAPVPRSLTAHDAPRGIGTWAGDRPMVYLDRSADAALASPVRSSPVTVAPVCAATAFCYACLVPGGGHFYTGETVRGAALLGVAVGSVTAGALLSSSGGRCQPTGPDDTRCQYNHETHDFRGPANRTPLYVGAALAAGSWIYGAIDASSSAARVNARNGVALGPLTAYPEPAIGVAPDGRAEIGVRLRLSQ